MATPNPRSTKARRKTEQILQTTQEPLTLAQLYAQVRHALPTTAHSTVFRIIQKLEQSGQVNKVNWKDRGALYEWAQRPHHHHVVCERCETVQDIDDRVVGYDEHRLTKTTGFIITQHTVELMGVCRPCQKTKRKK